MTAHEIYPLARVLYGPPGAPVRNSGLRTSLKTSFTRQITGMPRIWRVLQRELRGGPEQGELPAPSLEGGDGREHRGDGEDRPGAATLRDDSQR
jgi:hypothetical protein